MYRLAGVGLALGLAPVSLCQTASNNQVGTPFTIAIDQPVYTNEPVWVRAVDGPSQRIRYPILSDVGSPGCHKLEVRHDGILLTPRLIPVGERSFSFMGGLCGGSEAPDGSPQGRFPLHISYPLTEPGTYSVRWTILDNEPGRRQTVWESQWLTFTVLAATPEEHEEWIRKLLANPPEDPGHLAGDFLPSLVAEVPDPRALQTFVSYLYSHNQVVAQYASSALGLFPKSEAMGAVVETIEDHGPSEELASYAYAGVHGGGTLADEDRIVRAAVQYLNLPDKGHVAATPHPYVLSATGAAIRLLRMVLYTPNHAWPADSSLTAWAEAQVLRAAPAILANADEYTVSELAQYLGMMQPSGEAHSLLLRIADRDDNAGTQAKICLTWHR